MAIFNSSFTLDDLNISGFTSLVDTYFHRDLSVFSHQTRMDHSTNRLSSENTVSGSIKNTSSISVAQTSASPPGLSGAGSLQIEGTGLNFTNNNYENFSVVSRLLPKPLIPHFHAVYSFCRWADDLGDETGGGEKALEYLLLSNKTIWDCL